MSTLYTCDAVQSLLEMYEKEHGNCYTLVEGTLGYGTMVCVADGYKTAIITEEYLNEWSSAHKIRFYNTCPVKYAKAVFEKYGDRLAGFTGGYSDGVDGLREYLTDTLMPKAVQ